MNSGSSSNFDDREPHRGARPDEPARRGAGGWYDDAANGPYASYTSAPYHDTNAPAPYGAYGGARHESSLHPAHGWAGQDVEGLARAARQLDESLGHHGWHGAAAGARTATGTDGAQAAYGAYANASQPMAPRAPLWPGYETHERQPAPGDAAAGYQSAFMRRRARRGHLREPSHAPGRSGGLNTPYPVAQGHGVQTHDFERHGAGAYPQSGAPYRDPYAAPGAPSSYATHGHGNEAMADVFAVDSGHGQPQGAPGDAFMQLGRDLDDRIAGRPPFQDPAARWQPSHDHAQDAAGGAGYFGSTLLGERAARAQFRAGEMEALRQRPGETGQRLGGLGAVEQAMDHLAERIAAAEYALQEAAHRSRSQGGDAAVGHRLDEIGTLLHETQARVSGLEEFGPMLHAIMDRLEAGGPAGASPTSEQFSALIDRLDATRGSIANAAAIAAREAAQQAAMVSQSAARQTAEEAARLAAHETLLNAQEAARAAVIEAMHAMPAPHQGAGQGQDHDQDLVRMMQDNLASLRENVGSSEQRTQNTLEALHDTMIAIVERLATLEDNPFAGHGGAPGHGPHDHGPHDHGHSHAPFEGDAPATRQGAEPAALEPRPAAAMEINRPREPGSGPPPGLLADTGFGATPPEAARPEAPARQSPPGPARQAARQAAMPPATPPADAAPTAGSALRAASTNEDLRAAARRAAQAASNQQAAQTRSGKPKQSLMSKLRKGGKDRQTVAPAQPAQRIEPRLAGNPARMSSPGPAVASAGADVNPDAMSDDKSGGRGRTLLRSLALAAAAVILIAGSARIYSMLSAPATTDSRPHPSAQADQPGLPADVDSQTAAMPPSGEPGPKGEPGPNDEPAAIAAVPEPSSGQANPDDQAVALSPGTATDQDTPQDPAQDSGSGEAGTPPASAPAAQASGENDAAAPAAKQAFELPDAAVGPDSLREAAAAGDVAAQYEVASRYAEGRGVARDLKLAAHWYRNAAGQGLAPAQYRLGSMYEKGNGVPKDRQTARIWYERAANAGNRTAMHNLAVLHADGVDGKPDFDQAVKWFRLAADHGLNDSQYNLAILYVRGMGVPQSFAEAYKWFAILADKGDTDAAERLKVLADKLDANGLAAARLAAQTWKAKPLDPQANAVRLPPGGWQDKTSSANVPLPGVGIVRVAQKLLAGQGLDPGPADGMWGPQTEAAVRAFEKRIGQSQTGILTPALLRALQEQRVASASGV